MFVAERRERNGVTCLLLVVSLIHLCLFSWQQSQKIMYLSCSLSWSLSICNHIRFTWKPWTVPDSLQAMTGLQYVHIHWWLSVLEMVELH